MRQTQGIRVGVVGVGQWGSRHIRVLRSTAGVSAIVGIDGRLAEIPAMTSGDVAGRADLGSALAEIDAVVIATPPASHYPLGMQAIAAGKHVLMEKPLATTAAEARLMAQAAEAAGTLLLPGHTFLYNAAVRMLRELVQGGELGQLYYLDSDRLNLGLYQPDVNVVFDLAPHDVSITNFVLNSRPTTVTAWGSRHVHPDREDVAHLRLDYSEVGVRANIHVSWLNPGKVRRVTAVGARKMAVFDDMAGDERLRIFDKFAASPQQRAGPLSRVGYHRGGVLSPPIDFAEPLAVEDQHFVDCIIGGQRPANDGWDGVTVVEVLECAQISLREQRTVAVAELTQGPLRPGPQAAGRPLPFPASTEERTLAAVRIAQSGSDGNGQYPVH